MRRVKFSFGSGLPVDENLHAVHFDPFGALHPHVQLELAGRGVEIVADVGFGIALSGAGPPPP